MKFGEVWNKYELELTKYVGSNIKNDFDTKDLMQEIAIKIYTSLEKLKTVKNIRAYLYQISRSVMIDFYNKTNKKIDFLEFENTNNSKNIDEKLIDCVFSLANSLKKTDNEILHYKFVDNLSYEQIAKIMNLSTSGVKSKLSRAKQKLTGKFFSCCDYVDGDCATC